MIDLKKIKKIHFIGIGGSGMSSLAEIFLLKGFDVSGFDDVKSSTIDYLEEKGVNIDSENEVFYLDQSDLVIYSSAISVDHSKIAHSQYKKKKIIKRAEALGLLLKHKISFAIAGTHGKTTTTNLFYWIWKSLNQSPTIIAGGSILGQKTGCIFGGGKSIIVEADEYDRSFLKLFPDYSILNNLEEEHLDCYDGYADLERSFVQFLIQTKCKSLINIDDENLRKIFGNLSLDKQEKIITFGTSSTADYQAIAIEYDSKGSCFVLKHKDKELLKVFLPLLGLHNVMNVLGVLGFAHYLKMDLNLITPALKLFPGVTRRLELLKEVSEVQFYDDYAHHPQEVLATLTVIKKKQNYKRLIVVFQPHLFSRTQEFFEDFAKSLSIADVVFLASIFSSREKKIEGVTSFLIHQKIGKEVTKSQVFEEDSQLIETLVSELKPRDFCLFMGAGPIRESIGEKVIQKFSQNKK